MAKRTLEGRVVSDKMEKTRILEVEERHMHKRYKKIIRRTKRFKFHDEENRSHVGDIVQVLESRPLSKDKHWRLVTIVLPVGGQVASIGS